MRRLFHALFPGLVAPPVTPQMAEAGRVWKIDRVLNWTSVCPTCQAVACQCSGSFKPQPAKMPPPPRTYKPGERVRVKGNSGFSVGAIGTVRFQEPNGAKCWINRDGEGPNGAAWFYNTELEIYHDEKGE